MTDDQIAQLDRLERDMASINQRLSADTTVQCTPEFPHEGLRFNRGPNVYLCHCRKVYEKGAGGTLREVV